MSMTPDERKAAVELANKSVEWCIRHHISDCNCPASRNAKAVIALDAEVTRLEKIAEKAREYFGLRYVNTGDVQPLAIAAEELRKLLEAGNGNP